MTNKTWISNIWDETKGGKLAFKSIYAGKRLNEIILPGTDNSCSTKFIHEQDNDEHKFFPVGFTKFVDYNKLYKSKWHITQTDTITALLDKGIRYFHFRISWFDNEWFISNKYRHIKLNEILKDFKTFLKDANNGFEFVYLDFELDPNHYSTNDLTDRLPSTSEIKKFYEILRNELGSPDQDFPHTTDDDDGTKILHDAIYIPQEEEIKKDDWMNHKWHNNWETQFIELDGRSNQEFEYTRNQDGTKTIYDHLLRRKALVDKQADGYTRGLIKLPTLDKVFKKAVIFVDQVLYEFKSDDEKSNYNIIKPFPSFIFKNNSLDMNLVIDETPNQIHNANQQWLYHTKNKTNLIPFKYENKNYKFIDSMFNKLQLSHSISDRFYETNINSVCDTLKDNKILQHGRRSNWYERKTCKRQSFATRTSINMIYLKVIIKILLWAIPILQILSFFNPVGGPYWGLYITIYERDSKFYIIILALVFFVIVIFISRLYKYFIECIPNLDQENNEEIASNLIAKFDKLSTSFPWNIRQTSVISVNYPTDDIITKIINLNQNQQNNPIENSDPPVNPFEETVDGKNQLIYTINPIHDNNKDKLEIKLWKVRTKDVNGAYGPFIGKLKFHIYSVGNNKPDPNPDNLREFLVDQDNLIINNNTAKLDTLQTEDVYTYTHIISLHRLIPGDYQLKLWIEDIYGVSSPSRNFTRKWSEGEEMSVNLTVVDADTGSEHTQKWTEPFKNITQIPSNSSQRLKQFYESRLF